MARKRFFKKYKREGKTNYHKRLNLLKSDIPRLVIRISSKNILAQLVKYEPSGDVVLFAVSTKSLEKLGWKASRTNIPAAYLLGYLLAKKSLSKVPKAILDIGEAHSVAHSKIYAAVKGVIDGGVEVPMDESIFPSEERISGSHVKAYAEKLLTEDKEAYNKLFSKYIKNNLKPEDVTNHFNETKQKIEGVK